MNINLLCLIVLLRAATNKSFEGNFCVTVIFNFENFGVRQYAKGAKNCFQNTSYMVLYYYMQV